MKTIYALFIIGLLLVGCQAVVPVTPEGTPITSQGTYEPSLSFSPDITVKQFSSEQELQNVLSSASIYPYYGFSGRGGVMMESAIASDAVKITAPSAAGTDYSQTNNQVENVDEADIVKTDGEYIYTASNNIVYIVKAYPAEDGAVISSITMNDSVQGLFVEGDTLVVLGSVYQYDMMKSLSIMPQQGLTYVRIYDISDRETPVLEKEYAVEGTYTNARMYENTVYLISTMYPTYDHPYPILYDGIVAKTMPLTDIYYFPMQYNSPTYATVTAIDPENFEMKSSSLLVEGYPTMYMSENNIYLAYTEYINEYEIMQDTLMTLIEPRLSDADTTLIEKIKTTDNDVLSQAEKRQKIVTVYMNVLSRLNSTEQDKIQDTADTQVKDKLAEYEALEFTVIHRVAVDGLDIAVAASGKVPGSLNNQFALDEFDGNLRVATTIQQRWSQYDYESTPSRNNVYVLDADLDKIGSLTDLAKGEQIYSTRFMGDRLYMVTFRQVDPFFVIDLSNPRKPEVLGELKIPGFSRYLHPYDENTIIGIGQDASDLGRVSGLKISLYDVTDIEHPTELAKYTGDDKYAYSTALYEHKAFLFSKEKNLLVIPAYNYDYENSENNYNGALVFNLQKGSIELRGLIEHNSAGSDYYYYGSTVERSLYIEDVLYTVSSGLVRGNDIDTLRGVMNVSLVPPSKIPRY